MQTNSSRGTPTPTRHLHVLTDTQMPSPECPPSGTRYLFIHLDTITVSNGGTVPLVTGVDIQCYNYTLTNAFNCTPNIAIAVSGLESQYSSSLFFSIKAVASDSNTVIPFVVRTQWGYTRWTKLTFSFLAEASAQI